MQDLERNHWLLQAFDQLNAEREPLPKHFIIFLSQDTRELYASVLAAVLLSDAASISEPQIRLLSMLLRSMQLERAAETLLAEVGVCDVETVVRALRLFAHPDLYSVLLLDVMFLLRSAAKVSAVQVQVLLALCRAFNMSTEQVDELVALCRYGFTLEPQASPPPPLSARTADLLQRQLQPMIAEKYNQLHTHDVASGVWVDPKTGLMWSRICIGQEWQNGEAKGKAKYMNWDDAHQACKDLFLEGFTDWRLPNKQELESLLIEGQKGYNAPDGILYPPKLSTPQQFGSAWSATTNDPYTRFAWIIRFGHGSVEAHFKGYSCLVRAVRGSLPVT